MKISNVIKTLETKLINDAKLKFRNIVGHSKEEMLPGVFAEEQKAIKNIQNRIIKPSERLSKCQEEIKVLHESGQNF